MRRSSNPSVRATHRMAGITLLEVTIAMTVMVLIFGIAVPNVLNAVSRTRATAARAELSLSLFESQRLATERMQEVVLCPSTGGQCIGGTDWSRGWILFIDANGDRMRGMEEPVVHHARALPRDVHLIGSAGRPRIVYQPRGASAGSNATFTLCDRRGPRQAQDLILSNGGRLRVAAASPGTALRCDAGLRAGT